jgi:DNA-binding XRE family transcriptional regulator
MSLLKDRLKEARSEAKLTQQALGLRVGVPQSTIGALETGEHKTARNIAEIAAVMDGTLSYVDHGIPPHVLALAERLALIPDEKLKAVSVLLGIKL